MAEIFAKLPDDICQKFLSCLNLKHRAIASLVCRKWHHMITSLDDNKFVRKLPADKYGGNCPVIKLAADNKAIASLVPRKWHYMIKPLDGHHTMIRSHDDNDISTEFYLSSSPFEFPPLKNFESRLLTVLHLKYCRIGCILEFPCLKEINFDRVAISTKTLSEFIGWCPSIVELTLIRCCYLYTISVPHQEYLKKVHVIYGDRHIAKIEIKARNLREFQLSTSTSSLEVDLKACAKLEILNIHSEYIPSGFLQDICSTFRCLKALSLCLCKRVKKIKILSPKLENLTLSDMVDLEDAVIDTPNLRSFKLINMGKVPSWCPVVGSSLLEAEIGLKYVHTTNRLIELRTFAENLGENVTLSFDKTDFKDVISHSGNLQSSIEPLSIKHINLEIPFSLEPIHEPLIDELLSYFHPRTLLVRVDSDELKCNFIQVLLDEEKGQKTNCSQNYKCSNFMSWRNALKSFEIHESTTTTKQGAHQISLEFHWYLPYKDQSLGDQSLGRSQ